MKKTGKYRLTLAGLVLLALLLAALELLLGGVSLSIRELLDPENPVAHSILTQIRIPRLICAILSGCGLALAGSQMQAVFRNPLADPHILGITSGSGLGAALAAAGALPFATAGNLTIAAAALAGAALASAGIVAVSVRFRGATMLLIFGVLLGFVCSALTMLTQYFSSEESLKLYHSWVSGSFSASGWDGIVILAIAVAVGIVLAASNLKGLDIILFGDEFAKITGANVRLIRIKSLLSCCLMTAAITAFCGPIGFVGIIAPHITKTLLGTSVHRRLMIPVMLTGAVITMFADVITQCFGAPLPVGCTVALAGIPVIMWLLLGRHI